MSDPMFHRVPTSPARSLGPRGTGTVKRGSISLSTPPPPSNPALESAGLVRGGFWVPPRAPRSSHFRAVFSPTPPAAAQTESARLSAQIKDFLKRSDHLEMDWNKSMSKGTKGPLRGEESWNSLERSETMLQNPSDEDEKTENEGSELEPDPRPPDLGLRKTTELRDGRPRLLKLQGMNMKYNNACALMVSELQMELSEGQAPCTNGGPSWRRTNGSTADLDQDLPDSLYKARWERSRREVEILKERLRTKDAVHSDQMMSLRKNLERAVMEAREETEAERGVSVELKRRLGGIGRELSELKSAVEAEEARARQVEKKGARSRTEVAALESALRAERQERAREGRERELSQVQLQALHQEVERLKSEKESREGRLRLLEAELEAGGGMEEKEVMRLVRKVKDLEAGLEALSEERDDLRSQVETLEGLRSKLKLGLEESRRSGRAEARRLEEELDGLQQVLKKKVGNLEASLEEEIGRRMALVREKQETDRRLSALSQEKKEETARRVEVERALEGKEALLKDVQVQLRQQEETGRERDELISSLSQRLDLSRDQVLKSSRLDLKREEETRRLSEEINALRSAKSQLEGEVKRLEAERLRLEDRLARGEEEGLEVRRKLRDSTNTVAKQSLGLSQLRKEVERLEAAAKTTEDGMSELRRKLEAEQERSRGLLRLETKAEVEELKVKRLERDMKMGLDRIRELSEALERKEAVSVERTLSITEPFLREKADSLDFE